jgi:hypothetical protein
LQIEFVVEQEQRSDQRAGKQPTTTADTTLSMAKSLSLTAASSTRTGRPRLRWPCHTTDVFRSPTATFRMTRAGTSGVGLADAARLIRVCLLLSEHGPIAAFRERSSALPITL